MFTGIIRSIGTVQDIQNNQEFAKLAICCESDFSVTPGSSVAINGVCLTVADNNDNVLYFEVMQKTLEKTTIGTFCAGTQVNMETAMKVGNELGGHMVYGHVDTTAFVVGVVKSHSNVLLLSVQIPDRFVRYIVPQGSIAIDGVSLTVAKLEGSACTVSLVDYTVAHTTLGTLKKDDMVNIEVDMIAKYVESLMPNTQFQK